MYKIINVQNNNIQYKKVVNTVFNNVLITGMFKMKYVLHNVVMNMHTQLVEIYVIINVIMK